MPSEFGAPRRRHASFVALAILGVGAVASAVIVQRSGNFPSREVHETTVALTQAPQSGAALPPPQVTAPATVSAPPLAPSPRSGGPGSQGQVAAKVDPRLRRGGATTAPPAARRAVETPSTSLAAPASESETAPTPIEAPAPPPVVETAPALPAPPPSPRAQSPVVEAPANPLPTAVDPGRASVGLGSITTSSGISGTKVRVALAHAPLTNCYRDALAKRPSSVTVQSTLKIEIDITGRVVSAQLSDDGNLPGLRACIEAAARGAKVRDVDTGDGSATINLTLTPQ